MATAFILVETIREQDDGVHTRTVIVAAFKDRKLATRVQKRYEKHRKKHPLRDHIQGSRFGIIETRLFGWCPIFF